MPFIAEAASTFKSRFGYHHQDRPASELLPMVKSTPDLISSKSSSVLLQNRLVQSSSSDDVTVADDAAVTAGSSSVRSFDFDDSDSSFWKDHNVQVIIRIRPLSSSEISTQGYSKCVRQDSSQTVTWTGHPESRFTFDIVADENVNQEKLFKVAGVPMVENCVGGYNSCMFAYGQTGSGKTHTMLGDIEGGTRRHSVNCGMTPRVFAYLFQRIQKEREARRDEKLIFVCKCSFLEIYNEQILDLLDPSSTNLQLREDHKKGVYVENLKEVEVTTARDVMQQLLQGAANRKVASTNMNLASSRSHSVFTCIIESKWESQGVNHHRFARLNLVDLAGSERQKSSGAEGDRLKEATNINKSLSTLGLVIMNLVNISNGKSLHVPYRDSKLTFLLQDSLGGNSKTIIIANVSPSNGCSLETLSTLKFAQRAKFIKNNAIVNEDTSGDVVAMRMQIQQLKKIALDLTSSIGGTETGIYQPKEVSQLKEVAAGGALNQENDTCSVGFPGSPGVFKWEGLQGSYSPLTCDKRGRKDYDAALVGALRRENEKDAALHALAAENQAASQLAKQREVEIQGLKMRLRFREAGIKRLEAVVFGKISAETHLLKQNEEHLKEIGLLHAQVDKNQEVTRFAMENLRLKEEIRRLKSFSEEGERELMNEQIKTLQSKLLEALDWKLMHESESANIQTKKPEPMADLSGDSDSLLPSSQEPGSPWHSTLNDQNDFLQMQAFQNQSEIDTLHKKLASCLAEKEKLERRANELEVQFEEMKNSIATKEETEKLQTEVPSLSSPPNNVNDQIELKTLVDAIATASHREAEAHETAIILSKENEELRSKVKVLIEDNNKLIELYERAASETSHANINKAEDQPLEQHAETKEAIANLEQQLADLHEENERLTGLYENAMQDRDEFERLFLSGRENRAESTEETVIEMDEGTEINHRGTENLHKVKMNLDKAEEQLSGYTILVALLSSVEKVLIDIDTLSSEIKAIEGSNVMKQQELESLKVKYPEIQEKNTLITSKLSALKYCVSNFASSVSFLQQREARARVWVKSSVVYLDRKKDELQCYQSLKHKVEADLVKIQQAELETKNSLDVLKSKLEEENRRQETEKVLLAIDNVDKPDTPLPQKDWLLGGKATDLLKSEEEKPKLQHGIKQSREKLAIITKETEALNRKLAKVDREIAAVELEIQKASKSVEEMENALEAVIHEKEAVFEMKETGIKEIGNVIVEVQQATFEVDLEEAEMEVLEEELMSEFIKLEELHIAREVTTGKLSQTLCFNKSGVFSEKMKEELYNVLLTVQEARAHC